MIFIGCSSMENLFGLLHNSQQQIKLQSIFVKNEDYFSGEKNPILLLSFGKITNKTKLPNIFIYK